jgi:hypothetical protein
MSRSWLRPAQIVVALMLSIIIVASRDGDPSVIPDSGVAAEPMVSTTLTDATGASQQPHDRADAPDQSTGFAESLPTPEASRSPTNTTTTPPTLAIAVPRAQVLRPVRLRIPSLNIDAAVQWVGVDFQGRMGLPSNYTDVAWYDGGPTPGSPGNADIAGHFDSTTGPTVFYLITCDGPVDYTRREYDQRLVVYSALSPGP